MCWAKCGEVKGETEGPAELNPEGVGCRGMFTELDGGQFGLEPELGLEL